MPNLPTHGGDLAAIAKRYNCETTKLIDFSANINPAGPPPAVLKAIHEAANHPNRLASYPDPTAAPLREALAARLAVDPTSIVVTNGAAAAIDAAVRTLGATHCLLPIPAFSEYRRALHASGATVVAHEFGANWELEIEGLLQHAQRARVQLLILTNPHNPSGYLTPKSKIVQIIERCEQQGITVIIDEAFVDYASQESTLPGALERENAIVIRSMTKFYGMAGLRIGYAIANPAIAQRIAAALPSWAVGTLEITAAIAALDARDYEQATLHNNAVEREHLASELQKLEITVFPSSANFLLLELPIAASAMDDLIAELVVKHGIVVRDCRSYEALTNRSLIRVAVRNRNENALLIKALAYALRSRRTLLTSKLDFERAAG